MQITKYHLVNLPYDRLDQFKDIVGNGSESKLYHTMDIDSIPQYLVVIRVTSNVQAIDLFKKANELKQILGPKFKVVLLPFNFSMEFYKTEEEVPFQSNTPGYLYQMGWNDGTSDHALNLKYQENSHYRNGFTAAHRQREYEEDDE